MENRPDDRHIGEHDWHSRQYVERWIDRDVTRDSLRRPLLQRMLALVPLPHDAVLDVLDVGAGYGLVSEVVLSVFPRVRLTLHDYSEPMFEQARKRLATKELSYVLADLCKPGWSSTVGGPFDLIVSGLAIHNLLEGSFIKSCYRGIVTLLRPRGIFFDYDLFGLVDGGVATHRGWLAEAGFRHIECTWEEAPLAIVVASVSTLPPEKVR